MAKPPPVPDEREAPFLKALVACLAPGSGEPYRFDPDRLKSFLSGLGESKDRRVAITVCAKFGVLLEQEHRCPTAAKTLLDAVEALLGREKKAASRARASAASTDEFE